MLAKKRMKLGANSLKSVRMYSFRNNCPVRHNRHLPENCHNMRYRQAPGVLSW